jgi:hypothetical protein
VTLEAEDEPVLVVHANRVVAREVVRQSVQSIRRRNPQVRELRHGIELVQLPSNDRPVRAWHTPCGLPVDAIPD